MLYCVKTGNRIPHDEYKFMWHCPCMRNFHAKTTYAKLYMYIGVGARHQMPKVFCKRYNNLTTHNIMHNLNHNWYNARNLSQRRKWVSVFAQKKIIETLTKDVTTKHKL